MYKRSSFFVLGILAMVVAGGSAMAEKPRLFEEAPDPNELADFLFSGPSSEDQNTTRSWIVQDEPPSPQVAALLIHFEFDSTEFKPSSLEMVERLAQALITEKAGNKPVLIEGHTDAIGGEAYNLGLSKRRAQAVREYLVDVYRIEPARLFIDGRGESVLYNTENPRSAVNRRVQIKHFNKNEQARNN